MLSGGSEGVSRKTAAGKSAKGNAKVMRGRVMLVKNLVFVDVMRLVCGR